MHDYHDALPGYRPEQLLHDGCGECEARAARSDHGLANLDAGRFERAWQRAAQLGQKGLPGMSNAEHELLSMLWLIQVKLETRGVPIGVCPSANTVSL